MTLYFFSKPWGDGLIFADSRGGVGRRINFCHQWGGVGLFFKFSKPWGAVGLSD
jgi:hypothetical protein